MQFSNNEKDGCELVLFLLELHRNLFFVQSLNHAFHRILARSWQHPSKGLVKLYRR